MIELLKKVHLFETLLEPELAKIEKICRPESIARDTVIFKEEDAGDRCYIIMKGEVRISKFIPHIGEDALAVLKPGDYFGEMALIDNFPRSAHAIVNSGAELLSINPCELESPVSRRGRNAEFAGGRVLEGSHRLLQAGAPLRPSSTRS